MTNTPPTPSKTLVCPICGQTDADGVSFRPNTDSIFTSTLALHLKTHHDREDVAKKLAEFAAAGEGKKRKGMSKMKDDFYNAVHMLLVVDEGLHLTKKQFIQCLVKLMVIYEERNV